MRLDDHMMTVLTGLVFAIVLGTMAQNTDSVMDLFSDEPDLQIEDDVFFVRAGTKSDLDILANDYAGAPISPDQLRLTKEPSCGALAASETGFLYQFSDTCSGVVAFSYCVEAGGTCEPANVILNVREAPANVAIADAYLPAKGDLVPLPLKRVTKAPPVNRVGASIEQAVKINAFVVTFEDQTSAGGTLAQADELAKYLIDTSGLDILRTPVRELGPSVALHSIEVPLSASRSARFLRSYEAEAAGQDDPARTYDTSVFNAEDGLALSNVTAPDETDLVVPESKDVSPTQSIAVARTAHSALIELEVAAPRSNDVTVLNQSPTVASLDATIIKPPVIAGETTPPAAKPVVVIPTETTPEARFEPALSLPARDEAISTQNVITASAQADASEATDVNQSANACEIRHALRAMPAAHMRLDLSAPCHASQSITVVHFGLDFGFSLDANGALSAELPTLEIDPKIKVLFETGDPLFVSFASDDILHVERSVVITRQADGVRLAALEFDPATGQDRVVTAQNSVPHRDAYRTGRGYVRHYASKDARQIEVYTLPLTHKVAGGLVKLNLIEDIGNVQCANRAVVDFLHIGDATQRLQTTEVSIPDCKADYALGDVIGNIRIAAR